MDKNGIRHRTYLAMIYQQHYFLLSTRLMAQGSYLMCLIASHHIISLIGCSFLPLLHPNLELWVRYRLIATRVEHTATPPPPHNQTGGMERGRLSTDKTNPSTSAPSLFPPPAFCVHCAASDAKTHNLLIWKGRTGFICWWWFGVLGTEVILLRVVSVLYGCHDL